MHGRAPVCRDRPGKRLRRRGGFDRSRRGHPGVEPIRVRRERSHRGLVYFDVLCRDRLDRLRGRCLRLHRSDGGDADLDQHEHRGHPLDRALVRVGVVLRGVDGQGNVLVSTDPTSGTPTWKSTDIDPGKSLFAISCASASLCVAIQPGVGGEVLISTDPASASPAWTLDQVDADGSYSGSGLSAVSCPSASLCVGVGTAGDAVISTDPDGVLPTWRDQHRWQRLACVGVVSFGVVLRSGRFGGECGEPGRSVVGDPDLGDRGFRLRR